MYATMYHSFNGRNSSTKNWKEGFCKGGIIAEIFIGLIYFCVYLKVNVYKNPTCFIYWSVRTQIFMNKVLERLSQTCGAADTLFFVYIKKFIKLIFCLLFFSDDATMMQF